MYDIKGATIFQNLKIFHLLASNPGPIVHKILHFSVDIYISNRYMKSYSFNLMGSIFKIIWKRPHAFLTGKIEITGRSGIEPVTHRQLLIFFDVHYIRIYTCRKFEWSLYHIKRATIFRNLKLFHLLASNPWPVGRKQ